MSEKFKSTEADVEGLPHCPFCGHGKLIKAVHNLGGGHGSYTQAQCGDCSACVSWRFWERRPFVADVKAALSAATTYEQLVSLIEAALRKYKLNGV